MVHFFQRETMLFSAKHWFEPRRFDFELNLMNDRPKFILFAILIYWFELSKGKF